MHSASFQLAKAYRAYLKHSNLMHLYTNFSFIIWETRYVAEVSSSEKQHKMTGMGVTELWHLSFFKHSKRQTLT